MLCVLQVYKRLQEIDAYGAEARAATILAGLSFDNSMQVRPDRHASKARHALTVVVTALGVTLIMVVIPDDMGLVPPCSDCVLTG